MGVQGLWELLSPVGERVPNSHVRHKRIAVDASIWLTQFVRAMREAEGARVPNAHLIGVFRRCCKLLFLNVRPVMVFDGATPPIKRRTRELRRAQHDRDVAKLRRLAERLLMNQMRAAAVGAVADASRKRKKVQKKGPKKRSRPQEKALEYDPDLDDFDINGETRNDEELFDDEPEIAVQLPDDVHEINDEALTNLPANVQAEIFKRIRQAQRVQHRAQVLKRQADPESFSKAQIEGFMRNTALNRRIRGVRRAINSKSGAHQRIASDSNRMYLLEEGAHVDDDLEFSGDEGTESARPIMNHADQQLDVLARIRAQREKRQAASGSNRDKNVAQSDAATPANVSGLGWASKALQLGGGSHRLGGQVEEKNIEKDISSDDDIALVSIGENKLSLKISVEEDSENSMEWEDSVPLTKTNGGSISDNHVEWKDASVVNNGNSDCVKEKIDSVGDKGTLPKNNGISIQRKESKVESSAVLDAQFLEGRVNVSEEKESQTLADADDNDADIQRAILQSVQKVITPERALADSRKLTNHKSVADAHELKIAHQQSSGLEAQAENKDNSNHMARKGNRPNEITIDGINEALDDFFGDTTDIESGQLGNSIAAIPKLLKQHPDDATHEQKPAHPPSPEAHTEDEKQKFQNDTVGKEEKSNEITEEGINQALDDFFGDLPDSESELISTSNAAVAKQETEQKHKTTDMQLSQTEAKGQYCDVGNSVEFVVTSREDCQAEIPKKIAMKSPTMIVDEKAVSVNAGSTKETKSIKVKSKDQQLDLNRSPNKTIGRDFEGAAIFDDDPDITCVVTRLNNEMANVEMNNEKVTAAEAILSTVESVVDSNNEVDEIRPAIDEAKMEQLRNDLEAERADLIRKQNQQQRVVESISDEMIDETCELLRLFGIPFVQAPFEAEAQCSFLNLKGLVDGVITEDSDAFLFGAKTVYRHLFAEGKFAEAYEANNIKSELGIDRQGLINLAYLLGSDYTRGVRGIGIVNSMEVLQAFSGESDLVEFYEWTKGAGLLDKEPTEDVTKSSTLEAVRKHFCWKHRNMKRNWIFHSGFPNPRVAKAYWNPEVNRSETPFKWGRVDFAGLQRFCWFKLGWDAIRFDNAIGPLRKELMQRKQSTRTEQRRIEEFFKPHRFAKIKSERLQRAVRGIVGDKSDRLMVARSEKLKNGKSQIENVADSEDVQDKGVYKYEKDDAPVVNLENIKDLPIKALRTELKRLRMGSSGSVAQLRSRLIAYFEELNTRKLSTRIN